MASLDFRLKSKMMAKRDAEKEKEVLKWISALTGFQFHPEDDYVQALRDGQALCKLINVFAPGSVEKINDGGSDFKLIENINNFTKACKAYGLKPLDVFQTPDLWEPKDVSNVTLTVYALAREVNKKNSDFKGPFLVPRAAE